MVDSLGIADVTDPVEIGSGGFGTVYKAFQSSLRRTVAVKTIRSALRDERTRIRFEREIAAMGMLSGHPNIVTVYDSGVTDRGEPYIIMDYLEQGSLGDRLAHGGPMPVAEALEMVVKVAGALETAHQAGILHRDIKPENVLVSAWGEPKLGDFGIARLTGGPETGTASVTASIEHVAPELLESSQPSAASDLYALGSTLFKLLTGQAAFLRETDDSILPTLQRIRTERVPDLRGRGIPDPAARLVEHAMAKRPEERMASAGELGREAQDVQRALGLAITTMPVRAAEAAKAREATQTVDTHELASLVAGASAYAPPPPGGPSGYAPPPPGGPSGYAPPPPPGGPSAYAPLPPTGPSGYAPAPPPPPGYAPPAYAPPAYAPPAYAPPGPPARPPAGGRRRGPLVGLIVGLVVLLVGGIVTVLLLSGDDPPAPSEVATAGSEVAPTPPETAAPTATATATPAPTATPTATATPGPASYAAYERRSDDSGALTLDAPREWGGVDGTPWVIDGQQIGAELEVAPDLDRFRSSWNVPGVIFGASTLLAQQYTPDSILDQLDFGQQCAAAGRTDYTDPAYSGRRDEYTDCPNGASYTIVAVWPPDQSVLLVLQVQQVEPRDAEALQRILDSFLVVGALPEAAPEAPPTPDPVPPAPTAPAPGPS